MIEFRRKLKNFGPLEALVLSSLTYVIIMLIWTASTRSAVVQKANDIKANHKVVVEFINNQVNECSSNEEGTTSWGDNCNSVWISSKIVEYILKNKTILINSNVKKLRAYVEPYTLLEFVNLFSIAHNFNKEILFGKSRGIYYEDLKPDSDFCFLINENMIDTLKDI